MKQSTDESPALQSRLSMRRIAGLDGLRAIAAGLVLVYHLVPGWAGLGYIGVDIFFVLSGFLITSLLIVSTVNHGSPRLGNFWVRRFRRLFPAVFVATAGSAALAFIIGGDALVALGRQVIGSLTATYNWVEIASGSSYFEQASPLLLTNMWSLAVEQQFYLFWPLIVFFLVKLRSRWRIAAALAIAGSSIALHTLLVGEDVTRAYMGTDTHLWGLMLGAVLAFAAQRTITGADEPTPSRLSGLWGIAGWLALVGVIAGGLLLPNSLAMYPWGMVGASVLAFLVIRAMLPDVQAAPANALRGLLNGRVLSWLGVRSYGIYLWHWPLYVLIYYRLPLLNVYAAALAVFVLSIVLAHLSYRYVEDPIRRMGFKMWLGYQRRRMGIINPLAAITRITIPVAVLSLAVAAVATAPAVSSGQLAVEEGQIGTEPSDGDDYDGRDTGKGNEPARPAPDEKQTRPDPATETSDPPTPDPDEPTGAPAPTDEPEPTAEEPDPGLPTPEPTQAPAEGSVPEGPTSWGQVTIIGDSVVLAAEYALDDAMPGVLVDAAESRSIKAAPGIISSHAASGTLRDYVVISLATNGRIDDADVDAIMTAVGPDRTVIFVTAFGPARASWIPASNEAIHSAAERYPGRVYVSDWFSRIEGRLDLLAGDAIHPGREGAAVYAEMIRATLSP